MRSVRIAFVLFSALIVFFFLNSTSGKLFPATKMPSDTSSTYSDTYSKCNSMMDTGSYTTDQNGNSTYQQPDTTAYDKCIKDAETAQNQQIKDRYDTTGRDQIRNIYVVLVTMFIILITVALVHRRLPLLSAALLLGGLVFTLYFPTSNVVSGWYDSAYSMSDAVKSQLHNTMILASLLGFVGIVLTSIFGIEKKRSPEATDQTMPTV